MTISTKKAVGTVAVAVIAAATVATFAHDWTFRSRVALAVVCLGSLALDRLMRYGRTGADQWTSIIGIALLAAALTPDHAMRSVALAFVAAQFVLCFTTAAFTKLANPAWRSGEALHKVASTYTYGGPLAMRARRTPRRIFRLFARAIIGFELLLPLIVFLDGPALVIGIIAGLGFHLATAVIMGLHEFPLAFAPAYPALAYVATVL